MLGYVRRRHSTGPTGHSVIDPDPPPLSRLVLPRLLTQPFPPQPCLEVSPPNIAHPLTSNPASPIITTTIINNNKNNLLPLTLPPLLIPKTLFHAPSLSRAEQTWIWSQIHSSSPLLPSPPLSALPPALPSAGTQPSLFSPSQTAALPVALLVPPHLHLPALVTVALPRHPNPSYPRSNLLHLPQTINGVSPRPPYLTP